MKNLRLSLRYSWLVVIYSILSTNIALASLNKHVLDNGLVYYSEGKNIYNHKKELIIPESRGYNLITFMSDSEYGGFYKVEKNSLYGICDLNGKEIVSPKYRYLLTSDEGFYFYTPMGKLDIGGKKVYANKPRFVSFSIPLGFYRHEKDNKIKRLGKPSLKQHYHLRELWRKTFTECRALLDNNTNKSQCLMVNNKKLIDTSTKGFRWIKINDCGLKGVADLNGDIIIPAKYRTVQYLKLTDELSCFKCSDFYKTYIFTLKGKELLKVGLGELKFEKENNIIGYFKYNTYFKNNAVAGAYDIAGTKIVDYLDGYSNLDFRPVNGSIGYFKVFNDNNEGAVDIYGKLIIKPKKKDLIYNKERGFGFVGDTYLGIVLNPDGTADNSKQQQWAQEKARRRAQLWGSIIQAATQTAVQAYAYSQMGKTSNYNYGYTPNYSSSSGSTRGSLADQMSQPGYFQAVQNQLLAKSFYEVQQKEYEEFENVKKALNRPDLTYMEYMCMKGEAIQRLKDEGYDIIAEQQALNDEMRAFNRSQMNAGKENVNRIKEQNALKYGTSSKPISTTNSASYNSTTKNNARSTASSKSSLTSAGSTGNNIINDASTTKYDAHQQYKSGNLNTQKDSYGDKIKNVSMAVKDGSSYRSVNIHGELYKKNGQHFVQIGNTFFVVQGTSGLYDSYIIYGGKAHFFNK